MAKVLRSQEFSVAEAGPGGRREAVPKFLDVTRNRLEPFPGLRRLIVNPADMARIYSPDRRSRPPDPLRRSTRPARISPSGRVSFWATPIAARPSFPHAEARRARRPLSPKPETDYHSLVIRVCRSGTTHCAPAVASACHRRRVQPDRHERPSTASHVGTAACPFTRRGRTEVARSCRAQVCTFPRAASQRALAVLLR